MIDHLRLVIQDLDFEKSLLKMAQDAKLAKHRRLPRPDTWGHTGIGQASCPTTYFRADKRQAE